MEGESMRTTIFKTVAVFQIFDYLTLKAVESNVLRFQLPEGFQVVPKGEGYFVLLGKEKPDSFTIESPLYESLIITDIGEEEVITIWLYQTVTSFSKKIVMIGKPQERFYAYKQNGMRLLENKEESDSILSIFFERKLPIVGRKLLLKDGITRDIVTVINEDNQGYHIENNLKSYRKVKTELFVLFEGVIGADGTGVIVVPDEEPYQVVKEECE